jgi:hypothetical protein
MPSVIAIVIVRPEHLVSVEKRLAETDVVSVISEADLIQFHDMLLSQPPEVLLMHSAFAGDVTWCDADRRAEGLAARDRHGNSRLHRRRGQGAPAAGGEGSAARLTRCLKRHGRSSAPARARPRDFRWIAGRLS